MEAFSKAGFQKADLVKLNRCRLFLQVVILGDILDGSRDKVCNDVLLERRNRWRKSNYE